MPAIISAVIWLSVASGLFGLVVQSRAAGEAKRHPNPMIGDAPLAAARADGPGHSPDTAACIARELSRTRLIVEGGRELYIEPVVFVPSGTRTLLAGKPSYLFFKRDPRATGDVEARHTVFGAVVDADGSARTVPAPPVNEGRVAAVAGLAADAGAWRVIFAELDSLAQGHQQVDAFWHGMYDGRQWSALERLPQPPGTPLLYFNASPLAQNRDTLVWAALADLGQYRQGVVVFERHGGRWSHQLLATPFASGVEAVHTQALGFVLAITHADIDAAGEQSVFLYTRQSGWSLQRRMVSVNSDGSALDSAGAADGSTHGDRAALTIRMSPRSTQLGNREEPLFAVARPLGFGFATAALGNDVILWAIQSVDSSGAGELKLVRPLTGSTAVIWQSPNPYRGPFTAAGAFGSDVLIAGPELDEAHGVLRSLILRIHVACEPGRKTGS
jgi:hypothetical protein